MINDLQDAAIARPALKDAVEALKKVLWSEFGVTEHDTWWRSAT